MTLALIHRVETLDLKIESWAWPFAHERRAEIDAHFVAVQRDKPKLWNGQILLARDRTFQDGQFSARYFAADFASLLAWRDWGFPDHSVFNGFGMGALRCADGAFVLGEMSEHTANAGRVYFPAGTPDLEDIKGDVVDIAGNVVREIEEETGLVPSDYRASPHWDCVVTGERVAMIRTLDLDMAGEEVKARIEANLAEQAHPELAAIHLARERRDLNDNIPPFVTAFLERQFDGS